jgi:hypothetical protein
MYDISRRSIWNTTNNLFIKNGAINTPNYNTITQNNLIVEYGQLIYNSTTNSINFYSSSNNWVPIGIPDNNVTIGNLNFTNDTISTTSGLMLISSSTSLSLLANDGGITVVAPDKRIFMSVGSSSIELEGFNISIVGQINMNTYSILNCNAFTCNGIVGINGDLMIGGADGSNGVIAICYLKINSFTITDSDTYVEIDGPTITNNRFVVCSQNGNNICSFGLYGTSYYYIRDVARSQDLFRSKLDGNTLCIVLPTYSTTGTLQMSSGSVVSNTSDRRLKQKEEVLNQGTSLQQVLNLQPKKYSWNADIDRTQIGFIAQDVETVIPDAIDGKKYEYEFVRDGASQDSDGTVRIDEEGNPVLDYNRPRYRGLDQCAILAVLVSAFQEFHNNITSSLTSINTRLTTLENIVNNINSPPQT